MNITMQGRRRKRPSSLTPRSKEKLPSLVLSWPPRTRQICLWQPRPPRIFPPSHLYPLLPRSNLTLYGWTSLPSWPAMASWPVIRAKSVSKTICASIVVQETISWTPVPRSRPQSLPRAACQDHWQWTLFYLLFSLDFIFLFFFLFNFLFLEQLRLGFICHAVTSVTSWWCSHKTDYGTWENKVEGSRTKWHHITWTTHIGLMLYSWSFRVGCTVASTDHG